MSLRRRLLLGVLAVAAVLVGTNVVLAATFRSFLLHRVDAQVAQSIARPPGPIDASSPPVPPRGGPAPAAGAGDVVTELYFAAIDPGGTVRRVGQALRADQGEPRVSATLLAGHVAKGGQRPEALTVPSATGGGRWRVMAIRTPTGTTLVAGSSLDDMAATLDRMRWIQAAGTLAVLAALGLVSWWILRSGLRPLADMATTADAIAAGDLGRRVEHADPRTEAGRLGSALNAMLGQIEEAFAQREASEQRVRQFAADASHELRTPLTSIRGYADLWRAGGFREEGELDEAMRRMSAEAARMGALVEDLLLLARLDQARPLDRRTVRLDELASDAVLDASAIEPERPITLRVEPVEVVGDDARLRQVITNLLANTRAHTPPGTPVTVSVEGRGTRARLAVADEGPGLTQEVAARVFDRFYRADSARTRASGGSGLGLSIVAAIAEAHGGSVSVTAEPGAGCRFVVEVPIASGRVGVDRDRRGAGVAAEDPDRELAVVEGGFDIGAEPRR